jgi:hypothetical protein
MCTKCTRTIINICLLVSSFFAVALASPAAFGGGFELEGNIVDEPGADPTDWGALFNAGTVATPPSPNPPFPADIAAASIVRDFTPGSSADNTTFATGSKDTLNPGPSGGAAAGWQCKRSNNVTDKGDILDAGAALQIADNGDVILLFFQERNSNAGDANVGVWFLQDEGVACVATGGGNFDFAGNHVDGDILIVSEYSNGGTVSTATAYVWEGGPGGFLNPTPVATAGDCKAVADPNDPAVHICATVNDSPLLGGSGVPWHVETKQPGPTPSNDLQTSEFFEGKLNLTALDLVACFNSFLANTRASTSLTATIYDFALGDFEVCEVSVAKACTTGLDQNPEIVSGTTLKYHFDAVITNSGIAPVYEVQIQEGIAAGTGETCQLTAIDGVSVAPTNLYGSPNPWVQVAASLGQGEDVTARIECVDADNPLVNKINIRSKSTESASEFDLTDDYTMQSGDTCQANVSPMVGIGKTCTGVALDYTNGDLDVLVGALIRIENTDPAGESLVNVTVTDSVDASLDPVLCPANWATCSTNSSDPFACVPGASTTFDGSLAPSAEACFVVSYIADAADDDETDPGKATFSDTANVTATGAISGTTVGTGDDETDPLISATATCPLCPTCPEC